MRQVITPQASSVAENTSESQLWTLVQHIAAGFTAGVLAELIIQPLEQIDKVGVS